MQPLEPTTGRSIRLALVGFGLLALLAVVAFATRSGFGGSSSAAPTESYVSYAFTAFVIVFALMIPVAVYAYVLRVREGVAPRKSFQLRVLRSMLMIAFFTALAFGVAYLRRHHSTIFDFNARALRNLNPAGNVRRNGKPEFQPTFEWPVLAVAAIALAVGGAFAYRAYRRTKLVEAAQLEPSIAEDFAATISDAIDDLEGEPDARRAVIAAYARMEGVLARHGMRRRPSETPIEYLGRILGDLTSQSAAVARLTSLFQEARFSRHEIDGTMKRDAIDALRAIREDLAGAAAA
jgi:hypothetical protein